MQPEHNFVSEIKDDATWADPPFPAPDQLVVMSEGVYEGDVVEGVRYPSPEHMSG